MKATLEYTLPEEEEEFEHATRGAEYFRRLGDIRAWLRSKRKVDGCTVEYDQAITDMWNRFHELTEGLDV